MMRNVAGRVPPHDLDAEAAVLSAVLLDRDALDRVLEILKPEHFYSEANARIFQAAQQLAIAMTPIDMVSVASWLRDREWLQKMGGTAYLAHLADATPAVGHVGAHAKVVHEKWRLRQLIATCQRVAAEGYGDVGEVQEFVSAYAESARTLASAGATGQRAEPLAPVLKRVFEKITANAESGKRMLGTPSGMTRIDAKTGGMHDGDLIVVAGRSGMGKTSYALNVGVNVACPRTEQIGGREVIVHGAGVCIFSLEMPREQLAIKMICSEARVDLGRIRQGQLHADDWRKLTEAASYLSALPIWIDDTPALGLSELRAKIRAVQSDYDREATETQPARRVGLIILDYLQLLKGRDGAKEYDVVTENSKALKVLAKELNMPTMALSQLNRSVENRGKDKRPQMSDLRSSGQIEQDADTIILLYRDEHYYPDTTTMRGLAEAIIAKQRNGPTGKVLVRFSASCTRFDNLEPGDYPEENQDE
jgi:replicative DNA helicase